MSREQQLFDALEGALTLIDMSKAPDWFVIMVKAAKATYKSSKGNYVAGAEMTCWMGNCKTVEKCADDGCAILAPQPPAGQQDRGEAIGMKQSEWETLSPAAQEQLRQIGTSAIKATEEQRRKQGEALANYPKVILGGAPATAGEATAAEGAAPPKKVPVGEWISITAELPPLGDEIFAQLDCPSGANYERHEMVCTAERDATRNRAIASFDFWSGTGWGIIINWKRLAAPVRGLPLTEERIEQIGYQTDDADDLMAMADLIRAVSTSKTNGAALLVIANYRKKTRVAAIKTAISGIGTTAPGGDGETR